MALLGWLAPLDCPDNEDFVPLFDLAFVPICTPNDSIIKGNSDMPSGYALLLNEGSEVYPLGAVDGLVVEFDLHKFSYLWD